MKRSVVFHPFLFAIYLVLGVYSQNVSQIPVEWLIRPLVILLLITSVSFLVLLKVFKDPMYAGFASTVFIVWLFTGHIYRILLELSPFWRTTIGGTIVFILFGAPFVFLVRRKTWEKLSNPRVVTSFLNVVSVFLIVVPAWVTASTLYGSSVQLQMLKERRSRLDVSLPNSTQSLPDIYLIIVDGYGRADLLRSVYGYDNSQFLSFLEKRGFYIARDSISNYPQTEHSLASTLNLNYLQGLVADFGNVSDRSPLRELVQHTVVRKSLEDVGYKFVALPSTALFAQIRDADLYYDLTPGDMNEFEGLLLSSTLAGVMAEAFDIALPVQGYDLHRRYLLFSLDKLSDVPEIPGPKFVFTHLLLPHPPFIFDPDGNFVLPDRPYSTWDASLFPGSTDEYQKGYIGQMIFLNKRLMDVVDTILSESSDPPIIIIQGDHGPGIYYNTIDLQDACLYERYSILNAYYFPEGNYQALYPSITPVNSFRVILNQYFDAKLELLEDKSYFAGWLSPYVFTDVTDKTSECDVVSSITP